MAALGQLGAAVCFGDGRALAEPLTRPRSRVPAPGGRSGRRSISAAPQQFFFSNFFFWCREPLVAMTALAREVLGAPGRAVGLRWSSPTSLTSSPRQQRQESWAGRVETRSERARHTRALCRCRSKSTDLSPSPALSATGAQPRGSLQGRGLGGSSIGVPSTVPSALFQPSGGGAPAE